MKLKVCGMREGPNIGELTALKPDFIGFIFYEKSPRFVGEKGNATVASNEIKKVGVFVNPAEEEVLQRAAEFDLDMIQLHGDEPVHLVQKLKERGLTVIKVFSVMDVLPLDEMRVYEPYVDYFLFDTKTPAYGGSGSKFDWSILSEYNLSKPYFLSGGIDIEDIETIKSIASEKLFAIDINSRFEVKPGIKDIEKIRKLKEKMI